MIWKDYLKLSEIASCSKLARASNATPPPPRRNRVKRVLESKRSDLDFGPCHLCYGNSL